MHHPPVSSGDFGCRTPEVIAWLSELLQLKDEVKISIKELGLVVKIED